MKLIKISLIALLLIPIFPVNAGAEKVSGLVLLQVEDKGQLWYVNPGNLEKYYMRNNEDVFRLMKYAGLGVSNATLESFKGIAPKRLAGRILLKVEANGEAYYVNPRTLKINFLGRPNEAFKFMASLSVGAKNDIINQIKINKDFIEPTKEPAKEEPAEIADEEDVTTEESATTTEEETATTSEDVADEEIATGTEACVFLEEFFNNKSLIGAPSATGTTAVIDYNWKQGSPAGLSAVNDFSARWTANCYFDEGRYNFKTVFDEAVKIYIDGVVFIKDWEDNAKTTTFTRERNISEGYHDIKLEYYDDTNWANIKFSWERMGESSY